MTMRFPPPATSRFAYQPCQTMLMALCLAVAPAVCRGQRSTDVVPPIRRSVVERLRGSWNCGGRFADGRATAAHMVIDTVLEGSWLSIRHDDQPPGTYHALALWTADSSAAVDAYIADKSGHMRRFVGDGSRQRDSLTVARLVLAPAVSERFRYARLTDVQFTLTYERSVNGGIAWAFGDSLSCARQ